MRKTRLVILPTKCLHQMGFLLLFLSCPVIGDWGRIRPDNENLQRAIKVEREGTCGLQRDTPGRFHNFREEKGFNIRQFREDDDLRISRFNERSLTRNRFENGRELRRERESQERSIRSRSAESRRNDRMDVGSRSLSLSRLEAVRRQSRRETDSEQRKLSLARRMNERENERVQNERFRSFQRRESEKPVQRLSLQRREEEMRRQDRNTRGETERRLSLSRTEENLRRNQRSEIRETTERAAIERRQQEQKKVRDDIRNEKEKLVRVEREINTRREVEGRRQIAKRDERRMDVAGRRVEVAEKTRRVSAGVNHQKFDKTESLFMGAQKWLENYETPMIGDWSSSCVIGAVAYYLSTRQTKTV